MMNMRCERRPRALVLLNPASRGGRGRALWPRVAPLVARHWRLQLVETAPENVARADVIVQALSQGIRWFIAAGGDGTVSALVDALADNPLGVPLDRLGLAAIGLGSSNDFHKPSRHMVAGVPLRIDRRHCRPRDVCLVRWTLPGTPCARRHMIVSASLGVVARANAAFNSGGPLTRWLKRRATGAAIGWATLRAIAGREPLLLELQLGRQRRRVNASSLNVLKTPYLGGRFRLDRRIAVDDGQLGLFVWQQTARVQILRDLLDLGRGRFGGRGGRFCWHGARLAIDAHRPTLLEVDGEVTMAQCVTFEVLPRQIGVCG